MKPWSSLRGKLVLLTVIVQVGMLLLLVCSGVQQMGASLTEQADLRIRQLAASLHAPLLAAIANNDRAALQALVEQSRAAGSLSRLVVYNEAGDVLAFAEAASVAAPPDAQLVERMGLELGGMHYGSLEIGMSNGFLLAAQRALLIRSVLIAGAAVALSILLLALAGRWLTRHLQALRQTTRAWARGDLDAQAVVAGDDEIGRLAQDFNRMAAALRARVEALRQAREEFRAIADYTRSWEFWIGADGRLRWVNPSVERITGYSVADCMAMPDYPRPMIHPDDKARIKLVREKALGGEPTDDEELRVLTKSGATRWVRLGCQPIYGETGEHLGVRASLVDITPQKNAEAARRLSETRYADAARVARLGHWDWSVRDGSLHWSDETYRIFGLRPQEAAVTYEAFLERVLPEDRALITAGVEQALATDSPYSVEHRIVRGDGEIRHVHEQARIECDAAGTPIRMFGTVQDVTERRQVQLALARANRLYAVLSEASKAMVRVRDQGALFQRICRVMVEAGGIPLAWIGRVDPQAGTVTPVALDGPAAGYAEDLRISMTDPPQRMGPVAQTVRTRRIQVYQDIAQQPEMQAWWKRAEQWGLRSIAVAPLRQNGQVVATLAAYSDEAGFFSADNIELLEGLAADISFALQAFADESRRRQAEAELVRLNTELEARVIERTRALEAVNQELESFSYSVSHDLRAPLRSIDGFSRYLLDQHGAQLDGVGRDYLERIVRAGRRMGQLIDDLLMLAQIGRQAVHLSEVPLSQLAQAVVDELRQASPARAARVEIEPGLTVRADPRLMRIVLENLLGNAWKFSARTDDAWIWFGRVEVDGEQVLCVRDNGAGFDGRYAHKLFGPFQRLHSADEFEGTGIGLATVQRIITKHHGRIWAEGSVNGGAAFFFTVQPPATAEA